MSKTGMLKGYFKLSLKAAAVIELPQQMQKKIEFTRCMKESSKEM